MKLRNEMSMIYWVVVGMGVGMESNLVSKKDKRHCFDLMNHRLLPLYKFHVCLTCGTRCGRPWPAAYINFNQNIHHNSGFDQTFMPCSGYILLAAQQ